MDDPYKWPRLPSPHRRLTGDRHACLGVRAVAPCMQRATCRRVRASRPVTFVYVAAGTGAGGVPIGADGRIGGRILSWPLITRPVSPVGTGAHVVTHPTE
jgi:hypothetical protein